MAYARIKSIKTTKRGGKVLSEKELKSYLNGQLFQVAREIKEYIITLAEAGSRHKFRKDGKDGFYQQTTVDFNTDGVTINFPQHAYFLDVGRKALARKVPVSVLINWIKRYRILGRSQKTGKYQKASGNSINSLAFAIQTAIYKKGLRARNFIAPSMEYAEQALAQVIDELIVPAIVTTVEFHLTKKK
ncbi:hypothetical protein EFA69_06625 [Rufibacter immobilis]|uniref:Phage morphogenesis protein n=1 Tax=Rufibacter immobilis TaxID=1348778 RepID=A0A3M9MZI3_9BACT|nr:hypothetical protein [Rufibacter immobilis]RNI30961.1 hypothetical protein EFA69_06625 [Rufibacter immobilis]